MRHFLIELGSTLHSLWASLVYYIGRLIWLIGHEWKDISFVVLIVVAVGAALWSLRSRHIGRAGS